MSQLVEFDLPHLLIFFLLALCLFQSFSLWTHTEYKHTTSGVIDEAEGDSSVFVTLTEAEQKVAGLFFLQQSPCSFSAHKPHDETTNPQNKSLVKREAQRLTPHPATTQILRGLLIVQCSYPSLQRSCKCLLIKSRIPSIQTQAPSFCPHRRAMLSLMGTSDKFKCTACRLRLNQTLN